MLEMIDEERNKNRVKSILHIFYSYQCHSEHREQVNGN